MSIEPERLISNARWRARYDRQKPNMAHKAKLEKLLRRYKQKLARHQAKAQELWVMHRLEENSYLHPPPPASLLNNIQRLKDNIFLTKLALKKHYGV